MRGKVATGLAPGAERIAAEQKRRQDEEAAYFAGRRAAREALDREVAVEESRFARRSGVIPSDAPEVACESVEALIRGAVRVYFDGPGIAPPVYWLRTLAASVTGNFPDPPASDTFLEMRSTVGHRAIRAILEQEVPRHVETEYFEAYQVELVRLARYIERAAVGFERRNVPPSIKWLYMLADQIGDRAHRAGEHP